MRSLLPLLLVLLTGCAAPKPPPAVPAPAIACVAPAEPATEIQLYFGRDRPGGEVSEAQWQAFLDEVVSPAFPEGLTALDAAGRWLDPQAGKAIGERSKLVVLFVFDAAAAEPRVADIAAAYKRRFQQQSVLTSARATCVSFR